MDILVITKQKLNGVHLYRSVIPHSHLAGKFDINVEFTDTSLRYTPEQLNSFDIIHASYSYCDDNLLKSKDRDYKLVIDIDDYWYLDRYHELYDYYKENNISKNIIDIIKNADAITTTTKELASKIKVYNPVVEHFHNTLMLDSYSKEIVNPVPYMAYLGASNHTSDLLEIQHLQKGLGFPVFIPEMYRGYFKDRFLYYPPAKVPDYLSLYNRYDIILIPLRKNKFNIYKSPLKVMEAGFFKKPVIISDTEPFSDFLRHKENCLAVRKKSEWIKWTKLLQKDSELRKYLGENLYNDVIKHFDINAITTKRHDFYKNICIQD